jgi:hypothetical protein
MSKPLAAVLLSTAALTAAHADTTVFSTSVQLQAMLNYHDYSTTETWNSADAPYTGPTTAELLAETVVANTDVAINFNRQWGKAFAAPGILRADAYASIFAGDGVTSAHAAAKAGTTGSFIIDSPGRTGQAGWATISVTFSGGRLYSLITEPTPTAPAVGSSWLILDVSVGNSPAAHTAVTTDFGSLRSSMEQCLWSRGEATCNQADLPTKTGLLFSTEMRIPIVFGVATPISESLTAIVQGKTQSLYEQGYFSAEADGFHSAYWGGISAVTFDDQRVDYTVTSSGGMDWSRSYVAAAVPEPSSALLLAGGLAAILARRRRRRVAVPPSTTG